MRIEVNGNYYDVQLAGNKVIINGKEFELKSDQPGEITLGRDRFYLDFFEEGEPSLMIVNGMSYFVSRSSTESTSKDLKAPIGGQVLDVLVVEGADVVKGELLVVIEAMKMENQLKSPIKGKVKQVKVKKGQLVKTGQELITFE